MILGIDIRDNEALITSREEMEERPGFHRFEFDIGILENGSAGSIWEFADRDIKDAFDRAEIIALNIPASICLAKRMEFEASPGFENSDYLKWRASIQLPGDLNDYEYGFIPLLKTYDGSRTETLFFASPRMMAGKLKSAVFVDKPAENTLIIPEQIALSELLKKSVGKDDLSQAAIVNIGDGYIVVAFIRDNRYFRGRTFLAPFTDRDNLALDIQTYLLSLKSFDEQLPLVIMGDTRELRFDWSPMVPIFLNIEDLDFGVSWGLSEFVVMGGRCELPVAG